jgi:hypothetical protein
MSDNDRGPEICPDAESWTLPKSDAQGPAVLRTSVPPDLKVMPEPARLLPHELRAPHVSSTIGAKPAGLVHFSILSVDSIRQNSRSISTVIAGHQH